MSPVSAPGSTPPGSPRARPTASRGRGRRRRPGLPGPSYDSGRRVIARTSWPASASARASRRPDEPRRPGQQNGSVRHVIPSSGVNFINNPPQAVEDRAPLEHHSRAPGASQGKPTEPTRGLPGSSRRTGPREEDGVVRPRTGDRAARSRAGVSRRTWPWVTSARPVSSPKGASSARTAGAPRHRLLVVAARAPRSREGDAGDGHPSRLGVRRRRGRAARPGVGSPRPSGPRGTGSGDRGAGAAARRRDAWSGGAGLGRPRASCPPPRGRRGCSGPAPRRRRDGSSRASRRRRASRPSRPPSSCCRGRWSVRSRTTRTSPSSPAGSGTCRTRGERRSAPPWTR